MTTQLSQSDSDLKHTPLPGRAVISVVEEGVALVQLNVKCFIQANINVFEPLAQNHNPTAILLQETHASESLAFKYADTNLLPILKATSMGQPHL